MNTAFAIWLASPPTTFLLFVIVSLAMDGRVSFSFWTRLWLWIMGLLGPAGTVLAIVTLTRIVRESLRDKTFLMERQGPNRQSGIKEDVRNGFQRYTA